MDEPNSNLPALHGWNQPQGYGGQMFPGLGDPFAGPPAYVNPTVLPPGQGAGAGAGASAAKGGFSLGELKGMVDRMGGIDGVINGMGKIQKFVGIMSQMAPFFRVFLGKGAKATAASANTGSSPRRRPSAAGRRSNGAKGRSRRPATRRR
jgi:hypothetical protein